MPLRFAWPAPLLLALSCTTTSPRDAAVDARADAPLDAAADAPRDATLDDAPVVLGDPFCSRPGAAPDAVTVPQGFCARHFARVQHARVIRFAPGGELFVSSPNTVTSGYGDRGPESSRIALIPDDDHDGVGDTPVTFLPGLDSCHALLFAPGAFYYSSSTQILRMDYAPGQRAPGPATVVANLNDYASFVHWPHTLDRADDGTLYVSRGGDEQGTCPVPRLTRGAILALDGSAHGRVVARGMRNPMYLRCQRGRNRCYANELTGDFWDELGATEKLVEIHDGDDWGYPCCVNQGVPIPGADPSTDCSMVPTAARAMPLHDTPFGLDFETGQWPEPWRGALFIALHGQFTTWRGARVVAVRTDPATGAPLATEPPLDFATGWDDSTLSHGRPADVTFAPDGRLFVADDNSGEIFWVAPETLRAPVYR